MIIFYQENTGKIVGTVGGRVHTEDQLKVIVSSSTDKKKDVKKKVVNWIPHQWFDKKGKKISKNDKNVYTADFKPNCNQEDLFRKLDKKPQDVYKYRVDKKTKKLILNDKI